MHTHNKLKALDRVHCLLLIPYAQVTTVTCGREGHVCVIQTRSQLRLNLA